MNQVNKNNLKRKVVKKLEIRLKKLVGDLEDQLRKNLIKNEIDPHLRLVQVRNLLQVKRLKRNCQKLKYF